MEVLTYNVPPLQCGVVTQNKTEGGENCDGVRPQLPHDYRCNNGLHTIGEIERSREEFNWKVVEPYDGKLKWWYSTFCF